MTTKLQPTNIDPTLDYSVNKITVSGVDVLGYAQSAFAKANTGGASGLIYKASATTPATANIGDQWYSTTEDILYEYLSDGTSNVWVDITSSAITTNAGAAGGGSGTNNARSMINSYIFGS